MSIEIADEVSEAPTTVQLNVRLMQRALISKDYHFAIKLKQKIDFPPDSNEIGSPTGEQCLGRWRQTAKASDARKVPRVGEVVQERPERYEVFDLNRSSPVVWLTTCASAARTFAAKMQDHRPRQLHSPVRP